VYVCVFLCVYMRVFVFACVCVSMVVFIGVRMYLYVRVSQACPVL
jgi:hypothetical protein